MSYLARISMRFRYAIILIWVVAAALIILRFPNIGTVSNSDNSSFLPSSAPSQQATQLASPFLSHSGTTATLVAVRGNGELTAADEAAITSLEHSITSLSHVIGVRDQGISADGQARRAQIALDISSSSTEAQPVVDSIRSAATLAALPSGLSIYVTGAVAAKVDNQVASQQATQLTTRLAYIVILVVLFLVYRSLLAPLLNLAVPVVVLLVSQHVVAQLAATGAAGFQVSDVTQTMLTVLLLGAGTDYGIFLTLRVEEELRRGLSGQEAVVTALTHVGESITFSAGTVIAALLCLLLATFGVYHDLGPSLAIGIALMLLGGLTLLPALLAVFGRAVFWPLTVSPGTGKDEAAGTWGRIAGTVVARPLLTLVSGVVLFGALALAALHYAPGGYAGSYTGPTGSDSANGSAAIAAHYSTATANPTGVVLAFPSSVWTQLNVVQTAEQRLSGSSLFSSVSGPLSPNGTAVSPTELQTLYAALGSPAALPPTEPAALAAKVPVQVYNAYRGEANFISADGRTVQFYTALAAGDPTTTAALQAVPSVRDVVSRTASSVQASASGVYGVAAVSYDVSTTSDADLAHILPVVLVLIGLLLAAVMRSLVAPLYLVASVALSYAATLGLAVLIFMVGEGQTGLTFVLPFIMFIFLMALGEDYNILVMSRIREEAQKAPLGIAIRRALNATGTTVTSAGLILAATFGVAGFVGSSDEIRQLGIGIGLGVLLDTFLVRTLLVPSVVALLGRWNWWPSRLARQPESAVATVPESTPNRK
jgi:putative drug exporter of the RND superfamily